MISIEILTKTCECLLLRNCHRKMENELLTFYFIFYSAGLELVEQCDSPPDILLICCGGGGLCAGVATAVKLCGWNDTRIYAVEPQNGKLICSSLSHLFC